MKAECSLKCKTRVTIICKCGERYNLGSVPLDVTLNGEVEIGEQGDLQLVKLGYEVEPLITQGCPKCKTTTFAPESRVVIDHKRCFLPEDNEPRSAEETFKEAYTKDLLKFRN